MGHPSIDNLSAWLDHEVSNQGMLDIESHLADCTQCFAQAESLGSVRRRLHKAASLEAGFGFDGIRDSLKPASVRLKTRFSIPLSFPSPVLVPASVAAGLAVLFFLAAPFAQSTSMPHISSFTGNVWVAASQSEPWEQAVRGQRVERGSSVRLGDGGHVDIAVKGQYEIRVNGEALLHVASLERHGKSQHTVYRLEQGTLLAKTEKGFKGSSLSVVTPSAKARAIGTAFAVQVSKDAMPETWLGVLSGKVAVQGIGATGAAQGKGVIVGQGESTRIRGNGRPTSPGAILEGEWKVLSQLYQLGSSPQVALLVSPTDRRARELLKPAGIYISDRKPRTIPDSIRKIVNLVEQGLAGDELAHLRAISELKEITQTGPNRQYQIPMLLFMGAYQYYVDDNMAAVQTFLDAARRGSDSTLASLALCAAGLILEEEGVTDQAHEVFWRVLEQYPGSLEEAEARKGIARIKAITD